MKQRPNATLDRVVAAVNQALGELGCSYCRKYKPADKVRKRRTFSGQIKHICDDCDQARVAPTPPKGKK